MGEYEDVIERLREEGMDDEVAVLEKFSKGQLREKAGRAAILEKELEEAKATLADMTERPKREEALKAAGVDFAQLRKAEVATLNGLRPKEGQSLEEWSKAVVEEYALPVTESSGQGEPPKTGTWPPGEGGSPPVRKQAGPTITPEDFNSWAIEKQFRFRDWAEKNGRKDAVEALKRGEPAIGVAFS